MTVTPDQLAHLERHQAEFDKFYGEHKSVREYVSEHAHVDDLYLSLCSDMGLTPVSVESGNSGMCHTCLRACSHDYAPCPFCSPCEHLTPINAPESYPEVARFTKLMYEQLVANEHKGNKWLEVDPIKLIHDITWHWAKLARSYSTLVKTREVSALSDRAEVAMEDVREYAADIANIAMMLLDNLGLLPPDDRENSF